jgi:hypothetical protein
MHQRYGNKGVEIEFRNDADSSLHHLFYFSVNLSNDRLRHSVPVVSFALTGTFHVEGDFLHAA